MTQSSRPLRALAVVLCGWTLARGMVLWSDESATIAPPAVGPVPAQSSRIAAAQWTEHEQRFAALSRQSKVSATWPAPMRRTASAAIASTVAVTAALSDKPGVRAGTAHLTDTEERSGFAPAAAVPGLLLRQSRNPFSGSAWALMRSDGSPALAAGGQLGGSQIGMRIFYAPVPGPLAITARLSAPVSQAAGREGAIGVALRARNIGLIAEQRVSFNKSSGNGFAIFAYGGVSDVKLARNMIFDGYLQAGVVGLKHPAAFVDGALRLERAVLTANQSSLSVGAGAWGGAQSGASRIDIGPQIVARTGLAQTRLRVSAEWRQRVAGNAAPASGPSVTVGFDF